MRRNLSSVCVACLLATNVSAQEFVPTPAPELPQTTPAAAAPPIQSPPAKSQKRGWFGRILHPFGSSKRVLPEYKDPRLRGLVLELKTSPETVRLSEVRQLEVKVTLANEGKRSIELDFVDDQRIEIYLMNSSETVLTKWSDNHAITPKPGTLLINPGEHVEYNETIA